MHAYIPTGWHGFVLAVESSVISMRLANDGAGYCGFVGVCSACACAEAGAMTMRRRMAKRQQS